MNLNQLLIWLICLSCLMVLRNLIWSERGRQPGWILLTSSLLVFTLALLAINPSQAGLISGVFWGIFWLIPLLVLKQIKFLVSRGFYGLAYQLAKWSCWLHPADGYLEQPTFLLALVYGQQGKLTQAEQLFHDPLFQSPGYLQQAQGLLAALKGDWETCRQRLRTHLTNYGSFSYPYFSLFYWRSLAETGHLNDFLEAIFKHFPSGSLGDDTLILILAFCGEPRFLQALFSKKLRNYPLNWQKFWLATAHVAAGETSLGESLLRQLLEQPDPLLQVAVHRRLSELLANTTTLNRANSQFLLLICSQFEQKLLGRNVREADITYGLIAVNLGMFILQIQRGGSENVSVLYALGALVPLEVYQGQWWRLLTANFLHFGWVHFSTNMLGLYYLGPWVEGNLGRIRYLSLYLLTGILAMLSFSIIAWQLGKQQQILIGASAAIMGLFGALLVIFGRRYYLGKENFALKKIRIIMMILVLQFFFDLVNPQVSTLSHLLGLGWGLIITSLFFLVQ